MKEENRSENTSMNRYRALKGAQEDSTGNGFSFRWLFIVLLFIGELLLYTSIRVECTQAGYRILRSRDEQKSAESYRQDLLIEEHRLRSPDRIVGIAEKQLELSSPEPGQIIYLDWNDNYGAGDGK